MNTAIGVVVIGRNEGARLERCLASLVGTLDKIVYVDSGSTDGSVNMAQGLGVEVVSLDMTRSFTAARARNKGFQRLQQLYPEIPYVQFIDGDCEVVAGWFVSAQAFLDQYAEFAVVAGRCRERFPERSIYNLLCDLEWDSPVGEAKACGGNALMRVDSFIRAGGFRAELIAGEEPELCVRLRAAGWKIWRLDSEMVLHDAAMTRFGQWWQRTLRGGHAFAEGAFLHGAPPERHWLRECRRAWLWGLGIPVGIILSYLIFGGAALFLWLIYPLQVARLAQKGSRTARENWLHALFLVLGKFPEMLGQVKFLSGRFGARKASLIEYK